MQRKTSTSAGRRFRVRALAAFICLLAPAGICAEPVTASFSDAHGRSVLYRYELPEGSSPEAPQGVLIYFHGNNMGTQEQMLDWFFPNTQYHADRLDLIPVVVASFGERPSTDGIIRYWHSADKRLIHRLLQTDFNGRVRVDRERVFLWGGSQGTCFLNEFVPRYGEQYGGGLYAQCGCFYPLDPLWKPPQEFADRFRVFVHATTEDFLHQQSLDAYGYYRYTVGLDARSDLAGEGGHCARGEVSDADALNWLVHGTGLPDEPNHPHLARVSIMDHAVGLVADTDGALWAARQPPGGEARLWRSIDRGANFYPVSHIGIPISDLDAVDSALIATHRDLDVAEHALYRSVDRGSTFEPVAVNGVPPAAGTVADRHGRLFLATYSSGSSDVYVSRDLGDTWTSLGFAQSGRHSIVNTGPLVGEQAEDFLFTDYLYDVSYAGSTEGGDWSAVSRTATGDRIWNMAWDGETFWALAGDPQLLYSSTDRGSTWMEAQRPSGAANWWGGTVLNALDHGQTFVLGHANDGYLRDRHGVWARIYGSSSVKGAFTSGHRVAFDHARGDVYVTARAGVFRLDGALRAIDGLLARVDSDSDGIADALDEFPEDGSEYMDTDGDGLGNNRDEDDDGDGVRDDEDQVPLDPDETVDTDRDGIGDRYDIDDDGDGAIDRIDAFPLDESETADSDGDGRGDWEDGDDDGDGVADAQDAFRLYPGEWRDTDGDGIGDNSDLDDDGDGRLDIYDPAPSVGKPGSPALRFRNFYPIGSWPNFPSVSFPRARAGNVSYPAAQGRSQKFGEIHLGDGSHPPVQFMADNLGGQAARIYFDRNGNSDLTDDGPPTAIASGSTVDPILDIEYRSGEVIPYTLSLLFRFTADDELVLAGALPASSWDGDVAVVGGAHVEVVAGDLDVDGIFAGKSDYLCVDTDGDRGLAAECARGLERFTSGDTFVLDGRDVQVLVAASGHRIEIGSPAHPVPFFPAASHPDWQGFVQVTNRGDEDGEVEVHAWDDAGTAYGPLTLQIGARATRFFNSDDLEGGNPDKGLDGSTGDGDGAWRLELKSALDLDVLAYVRTEDGFLTRMHDMAYRDAQSIRVPTFNPGSNRNQVSVLRLVNPSALSAEVTIEGIDDAGLSPGGPVRLSVPEGEVREVSAADLETGGEGLTGALGDGEGKWRLSVTSEQPVRALSLLQSPTGHVTNLSTQPYEDGGPLHQVSMFPADSDPVREGFVRVANHSEESGEVTVFAWDDAGTRYGPVALAIGASATVHFNSGDLERGNPDKGLLSGTGPGYGDWWLEFESDLELHVLGYVRTEDGFLTSMHDAFHRGEGGIHVPTFNPGSNSNQVSLLRLVNPGDSERQVVITGIDASGASPGSTVRLSVPPRGARTVTSLELESGTAAGLTGALGDGDGKWQLTVEPDGPLRVLSLLRSPTDHLTNLSTMPERFPSRRLAADAVTGEAAAAASVQPGAATAPLAVKRAGVAVHTEPNVIVVNTETMGRIHFDLNTLTPDDVRITELHRQPERLR